MIGRLPILLLGAVLVAAACTTSGDGGKPGPAGAPAPAGNQGPSAQPGVAPADIPAPPDSDPYDLAQRYRQGAGGSIPKTRSGPRRPTEPGAVDTFTVTNLQSFKRFEAQATLKLVTPNAYWYIKNGFSVDEALLARSAETFEQKTVPTNIRYFGDTIRSGFDGDRRVTVLVARFDGAAGYYSSPDEYPKAVHPHSNERIMLYINGAGLRPGSRAFDSVVAHELQHALHWHADSSEESWVNEGLSMLAEELNGYGGNSAQTYKRNTQVQLTDWEESTSDNGAHYATAHLFMRFLGEHWGGYERLRELVAEPKNGIAGVDAYLQKIGSADRYPEVFRRWLVANLGVSTNEPRLNYTNLQVGVSPSPRLSTTTEVNDKSLQHAARYYELKPNERSATIDFSGAATTRLLATDAPSGSHFWWGNQGDSTDTTLTREVDLTAVRNATLQFKAWYEIETGWDFAYVAVSENRGATWTPLAAQGTTSDSPLGNNYGPGFTGRSGRGAEPRWVDERVDLSAYAGKKVLLRFEYVTDEAVHRSGFAVDDIRIPEIGFTDDAESSQGWTAAGFVRTDNVVRQAYSVQVVEIPGNGDARVRELALDSQNKGAMSVCCFTEGLDRAVLIVAPMAPLTRNPASYQLRIKTGP